MRTIIGTVKSFTGEPISQTPIYLSLMDGTYNNSGNYPAYLKTVVTNSDGTFSIPVVPNIGNQPGYYSLILPDGKSIIFNIPDGEGSIDLSVLREVSFIMVNPEYPNILEYLQDYIDDSLSDIQVSTEIAATYVSGTVISALRAVKFDSVTSKIFHASSNSIIDFNKVVGITDGSGTLNESVRVVTSGYFSDSSWSWIVGNPIFFNDSGVLTQTPGTAYYQVVAIAVTQQKILVSINEPILL